jgi:spermidine synthase/tetratricopeptide (TPR) repeat protein
MVTEIVFFRVLGLVFGVFNHAFSIVLAVFLLGLAIGSLLTASAERAGSSRIQVFAAVYMGLAVLVLLVQATMTRLPRLVLYMRQIPGLDYGDVLIGKALLACLFLLPFAIVAGMGVPLLLAHLSGDLDHLAGTVGAAYLVNTVGTVFGSLLAGFVLIPAIGTEDSLLTMAVICVLTGAAGLFIAGAPRLRLLSFGLAALVCVAVIGLPKWPASLFLNSDTQGRGTVMTTRLAIEEQLTASPREILFFKEGRNATVVVTRRAETRSLFIGGHPDASDQPDMATQTFLGIVPQVVRPAAEEVLVVGFGSGVTAGTLLKNPSVKRLDVVEMERAVVEASPLFHHVNGAPEEDPRFHVIFEDARSYVVSSPRQYDLMVSEPSNPWRAGIANVFTLDFFLESKQLLKKQGVFAQWLQLYSLDFDSVRLVLRTFHQAFPHVEVWWLDPFDLVILGSESEMKTEPKAFEQLLARHYAEEARRYGGIRKPGEFFSRYLMGTEAVRKVAGEAGPIHRDAFPVLEFEAPRGLFTADSQNHRRILAAKTAHSGWLPPSVRGQVPEGVAWLGFGAMLRSAGLWTEARDAFLRAAESGEPHRGLVFAAEVALDGKDIGPASRYLEQLSAVAGPIPSDVQQEVALTRADVAFRLGKPEAALELLASSPMKTVAVERERLRLLAQLGRVDEAEVLARELLQSAALGKENGAEAVRDTYGYLVQIASSRGVAQRLLPLVEKLPPSSAGFAEVPRLETLASLYARAGRPQEAFQAAERISDMGILSLRALLLKAALLERAGDRAEAVALREQVRILAPASVTDAVPVPLPAREKPGEGSVR